MQPPYCGVGHVWRTSWGKRAAQKRRDREAQPTPYARNESLPARLPICPMLLPQADLNPPYWGNRREQVQRDARYPWRHRIGRMAPGSGCGRIARVA